jgi:predicted aspartyl protease
VGIALSIAEELQAAGTPVPEPISGFALIDTGASATCVDAQVASQMNLPVVGTCTLATPSHESIEKNQHPVHIQVVGTNIAFAVPAAVGADLRGQGILALIGRDVLFQCILVYSGPDDSYSLSL